MTRRGLRRPKEPEESRQEFLDTAFKLFCERGYHGMTVDEVVQRAKRSKGGFYHHFRNKAQMFNELFESLLERSQVPMRRAIQEGTSLREIFNRLLRDTHLTLLSNRRLLRALVELYLLAVRDAEVRRLVARFHRVGIDIYKTILRHSISRGEIFIAEEELNDIAELLYNGSRGVIFMDVILTGGKQVVPKLVRFLDHEVKALHP